MICPNCKYKCNDEWKFCPKCTILLPQGNLRVWTRKLKTILLGFPDIFKKTLSSNPKKSAGWRDAARKSGYGIKIPTPTLLKQLSLCIHLTVTEATRKQLQYFLMEHWSSRSERLVDEFLRIATKDNDDLQFPDELVQLLNSYRKRGTCSIKQIAAVYIRHELNVIARRNELERGKRLGIKKVKIRTSEDGRVCKTCKTVSRRTYNIDDVPSLPLCWECRCYYEMQI